MVAPINPVRKSLTGYATCRRGFLNKVILRVEVKNEVLSPYLHDDEEVVSVYYSFRDATVDDMDYIGSLHFSNPREPRNEKEI